MKTADLVEKLKAQGFTEWNSGGGCTALRKDLENGAYVLVTDAGAGMPSGRGPFIVGYYVEGEQKLAETCENPRAALDKAEIYCAVRQRSRPLTPASAALQPLLLPKPDLET